MIAGKPFDRADAARGALPVRDLRNIGASLTTLAHACVGEHLHQVNVRDQASRLREVMAACARGRDSLADACGSDGLIAKEVA